MNLKKDPVESASRDNDHEVMVQFEKISSYTYDGKEYTVVYDKDTKVKYVIIEVNANQSGMTPLYNADGTLQLYDK